MTCCYENLVLLMQMIVLILFVVIMLMTVQGVARESAVNSCKDSR
jgi:hypothetical protein